MNAVGIYACPCVPREILFTADLAGGLASSLPLRATNAGGIYACPRVPRETISLIIWLADSQALYPLAFNYDVDYRGI